MGLRTRFDGGHHEDPDVLALRADFTLVPVCPEQLGGLATPRSPAELQGSPAADGGVLVVTKDGEDVSRQFRRGAEAAVAVAGIVGARAAVLKARSPSCGVGETYDGTFSRTLTAASGVAAAALADAGLELYTEEDVAAGTRPAGDGPSGYQPPREKESD